MENILAKDRIMDYAAHQAEEKRIQEAEEVLRTHDYSTFSTHDKLKTYDGLEAFNAFKQASNDKVKEIQAMQGPLYTDEGKANLIREEVQRLADEHIAEANKRSQYRYEGYYALGINLTDAIEAEQLTNDQLDAMKPMEAKAKTDLSFAKSSEEVRRAYEQLVQRGERDKATAKFAAMYGYMFMDRIKELSEGRELAMEQIFMEKQLQKAKDHSYSKAVRAKIVIKEHLEDKGVFRSAHPSPSTRLIEMHKDSIKKKYR